MNPRTVYRQDLARGAPPVRLVVLLYEQVIEDLRQAVNAIKQNNVELRTNKINHAIFVIGCLQSSLNKEAGGQVARDLERFYDQMRRNLVEAQFRVSSAILSQQIVDLLTLREAWSEVERVEAASENPQPITETADAGSSAAHRLTEWKT